MHVHDQMANTMLIAMALANVSKVLKDKNQGNTHSQRDAAAAGIKFKKQKSVQ